MSVGKEDIEDTELLPLVADESTNVQNGYMPYVTTDNPRKRRCLQSPQILNFESMIKRFCDFGELRNGEELIYFERDEAIFETNGEELIAKRHHCFECKKLELASFRIQKMEGSHYVLVCTQQNIASMKETIQHLEMHTSPTRSWKDRWIQAFQTCHASQGLTIQTPMPKPAKPKSATIEIIQQGAGKIYEVHKQVNTQICLSENISITIHSLSSVASVSGPNNTKWGIQVYNGHPQTLHLPICLEV